MLDAAAADGSPVALVGPLVHLEQGERARVIGTWVNDSRYGAQVKVSEAVPLAPEDPEALVGYLRRVKHVGARRAADLVARFGAAGVLDAIDRDPAAAFAAVGLRGARAQEAADSWQKIRVTRRLHLLLAPHGLAYLAPRIHEHYGDGAHELLTARPLLADQRVRGRLPDRRSDRPATGADGADGRRERAAIMHVLSESERSGSGCTPLTALLSGARELLGERRRRGVVAGLSGRGRSWPRASGSTGRRPPSWRPSSPSGSTSWSGSAQRAVARGETESSRAAAVASPAEDADDELTAEQRRALRAAFAQRLSVITGGPGTGKTASIKTIAATRRAVGGARVHARGPDRTRRGADDRGQRRARRARCTRRWAGSPARARPTTSRIRLGCDLLIVDETSMANLELLVTLLRAVGEATPTWSSSATPISSPRSAPASRSPSWSPPSWSPTTRLTHIFRQAADSMIVQAAHAIRRGEHARSSPPGDGMRRDLFLIERRLRWPALAEIVSLVSERLPAHYGVDPVRDIQVFAPVYRGELGIDAINQALRAALNPDGQPVRGGRLRLGDKLMMTGRNLHELGLMNGTVLRLLDEVRRAPARDPDETTMPDGDGDEAALILGAEESVFRLAPEDADQLRLAYACSVHRGQGIELPIAVIVAHPAAGAFFLRREMLYTAITRARLATVIVGTREVVARAARTPDTGRRHGRLGERLAALSGQSRAVTAGFAGPGCAEPS